MKYKLIVAVSKNRGIGKDGTLPWKIKEDLAFFSKTTKGNGNNAVIMGRKTWESLRGKPLPSRDNYILSSTLDIEQEISGNVVKTFESVETLDSHINTRNKNYHDVWVIGGAGIYKEYLEKQKIDTCYVTHVNEVFDCDTFFPELSRSEWYLANSEELNTQHKFKIEIAKYEKYKSRQNQ